MLYKYIIFVGKRNLWVNPLLKKKKLVFKNRKRKNFIRKKEKTYVHL